MKRNAPIDGPAPAGVVFATFLMACLLCVLLAPPPASAQRQLIEPEQSTGWMGSTSARAKRHMISTANTIASEAGREMLRAGGSAMDAAIAAQFVLGLVEPQSSGLGGGGFIVHWDSSTRKLQTYDGRETAPAAARPDRFLRNGEPLPFDIAVHSGLSVGTPGLVRLLAEAHARHGKLPWPKLLEPAITLARSGFEVSPRLSLMLRWRGPTSFDAEARRYFFDENGQARPAGYPLKNPAYASVLQRIAKEGPDAFYKGPVAQAVVAAVSGAPNAAGDLTLEDLNAYRVEERAPICSSYRDYKICGMGPPSSGGVAISQIMTILDSFDLGRSPADSLTPQALHLIVEAQKLAYADRGRYLADPAFVPVPEGLTDPAYIGRRRQLIDTGAAMIRAEPGIPPGLDQRGFGIDGTAERVGTTHISVIDGDGNAVSMTTTIEGAFGSGIMTSGFLLNNQLTDFAFRPTDHDGVPVANRVEAGKRPRSTMSPTIVFGRDGNVVAVLGSPGGGRIILYVVKALVALLDWKLDAQAAAALTNFGSMGEGVDIEYHWRSVLIGIRLKPFGHVMRPDLMTSGLNIVAVRPDYLEGASDPRREGAALGD